MPFKWVLFVLFKERLKEAEAQIQYLRQNAVEREILQKTAILELKTLLEQAKIEP